MIALLRTYMDIIALRKGPDSIPASWLVFGISLGLLALAWLVQAMLIELPAAGVLAALIAYAMALAFYSAIVFLFGFPARLLQMLSTLIACGSIVAILSAASGILFGQLLGAAAGNSISTLVFFWSVPVKGHVVARTIEKHWFFGVGIAMLAFILRFGIETSYLAQQQGSAL